MKKEIRKETKRERKKEKSLSAYLLDIGSFKHHHLRKEADPALEMFCSWFTVSYAMRNI
jgi:hypothetical protein